MNLAPTSLFYFKTRRTLQFANRVGAHYAAAWTIHASAYTGCSHRQFWAHDFDAAREHWPFTIEGAFNQRIADHFESFFA
jgi:hypothetical protein